MADSLRPKRRNAVFGLVGFWAGVPAVAPASAGRRNERMDEVKGKHEVRRRSVDAELWRTAFARKGEMRFSAFGFWAGVPAVAPASAGRRNERMDEVKGKHEVRRRSVDAELWRTAFARKGEMRFSAFGFWAGVPAVAPASAGRRNERMDEVKGKHEVRRRSVDAELWRTAFARKGEMRFSAFGFWAGVPAVAPASAGRRNERMDEVKGKHEVRRRSVDAELWRTAFARKGEMRFSAFGFWAGVPAVAPASAGRRNERMDEVKGKHEVRRRSVDAELWRTAFARKGEMRFSAFGFWAGVPAVAPASAGRRNERMDEVKGKHEVRRRSVDAELWRTAFARK